MQIIELNSQNFNKDNIKELLSKKICMVGIFSKFCIHCQNMKPEWMRLKNKLKNTKCNGILLEIDSDQLNYLDYPILNNNIKGYPSIMLFKNGKLKKEYNGNRSSNDMFKFFKPHMLILKNNNNKSVKSNSKNNRKNKSKNNRKNNKTKRKIY